MYDVYDDLIVYLSESRLLLYGVEVWTLKKTDNCKLKTLNVPENISNIINKKNN